MEENWNHARHLERQLWFLFSLFVAINGALLSVIGTLLTKGTDLAPSNLAIIMISFAILITVWAFFVIRIFVKWRIEFLYHYTSNNLIRKHILENVSEKDRHFAKVPDDGLWPEGPPATILGFTSVFMTSCLTIIGTTTVIASVLIYLRSSMLSSDFTLNFLQTMLVTILVGLFLMARLLIEGENVRLESVNRVKKIGHSFGLFSKHENVDSKYVKIYLFLGLSATIIWFLIFIFLVSKDQSIAVIFGPAVGLHFVGAYRFYALFGSY